MRRSAVRRDEVQHRGMYAAGFWRYRNGNVDGRIQRQRNFGWTRKSTFVTGPAKLELNWTRLTGSAREVQSALTRLPRGPTLTFENPCALMGLQQILGKNGFHRS